MFRRGDRKPELGWVEAMEALVTETTYRGRLDALLGMCARAGEAGSAHLYLAADDGGHVVLEHRVDRRRATDEGRPPAAGRGSGAAGIPGSSAIPATEVPPDLGPQSAYRGGADAGPQGVELEMRLTPDLAAGGAVRTAAGGFWAQPLRSPAGLEGVVLVGPVDGVPQKGGREALEGLAPAVALALRQARAEEALRLRLAEASARETAGRRLQSSAIEPERFIGLLLDLAVRAARSEAGFVAIAGEDGQFAIRVGRGLPPGFDRSIDLSPSDGLFDWSFAVDGGGLLLRDVDVSTRLGVRSLLAVPLLQGTAPLGVFALMNFAREAQLDENALGLLETYAEQVELMLANARLFASFSDRYLATLEGLARSLDARRPWTQGHHDDVAAVAVAVARAVGADPARVAAIRTAALIHDIGLAGVVAAEDEFAANLEHPVVGASMVEHLPIDPAVARAIATHHEAHDGHGTPAGLPGDSIPPEGRILAVAEFIAEMRAGTSVREPLGDADVIEELRRRRGRQFDPACADAAVRLLGAAATRTG
jgi:putative nucleotidyltransferase with HDIG domain